MINLINFITDDRIGFHVNEEIVIGGRVVRVLNVMDCTTQWINTYYNGPLERWHRLNSSSNTNRKFNKNTNRKFNDNTNKKFNKNTNRKFNDINNWDLNDNINWELNELHNWNDNEGCCKRCLKKCCCWFFVISVAIILLIFLYPKIKKKFFS